MVVPAVLVGFLVTTYVALMASLWQSTSSFTSSPHCIRRSGQAMTNRMIWLSVCFRTVFDFRSPRVRSGEQSPLTYQLDPIGLYSTRLDSIGFLELPSPENFLVLKVSIGFYWKVPTDLNVSRTVHTLNFKLKLSKQASYIGLRNAKH